MSKIRLTEKEMAVLLGTSASFVDNGDGYAGEGDVIVDKTATDVTLDAKLKPITLDASANTLEGLVKVIEGVTSRKTYVVTDRDKKQYADFGCGKTCDKGDEYIVSEPLVGFGDLIVVGGDIAVSSESERGWARIYQVDLNKSDETNGHGTFPLEDYCPVKRKKVDYGCATKYVTAMGEYETKQDGYDAAMKNLKDWRKNIWAGFVDGKTVTYQGVVEYLKILEDIERAGSAVRAHKERIEADVQKNQTKK